MFQSKVINDKKYNKYLFYDKLNIYDKNNNKISPIIMFKVQNQ